MSNFQKKKKKKKKKKNEFEISIKYLCSNHNAGS